MVQNGTYWKQPAQEHCS